MFHKISISHITVYAALLLLYPTLEHVDAQNDSGLDRIVADGAELEQIAAGFGFTEGPATDSTGQLFFTDLRSGTINVLARDGSTSVFRTSREDAANGLAFDTQGRLYACEGGSGRLTRTENDGQITVLSDQFGTTRFNSPNDLALSRDGQIYFTDPFFGNRSSQPQPVTGVYRIAPDGQVHLANGDFDRPNGIALSPDERILYVTNDNPSPQGEIWAFDIQADGALANKRLFATAGQVMDGMSVDAEGNVYATSFLSGRRAEGRGVYVYSANGELLGLILTPEQPTNCTLTGNTLYVTASTTVHSIQLKVSGVKRVPSAVEQANWAKVKSPNSLRSIETKK